MEPLQFTKMRWIPTVVVHSIGNPTMMRLAHYFSISGKAILTSLILFATTFVVYSPILGPDYTFIFFDDPMYVMLSPLVVGGFTWENMWSVFAEPHVGNYHPLTMLSLMLDYRLMGPAPWMFHFTNILVHSLNAVLVFKVLSKMTGAFWKSFIVALLFALHPSRVESVAWVSERKDVLFLFFWLLATLAYVKWVQTKSRFGFLTCIFLFLGSLMAKPMAVTFPFALLVLDFWPLNRLLCSSWLSTFRELIRLAYEKLPLFLLSFGFCLLTIWAQEGAIATPDLVSKTSTLINSAVAYANYFVMTICPTEQAIFYPYRPVSMERGAYAALLLICVSGVAIGQARSRPYILSCWLLFLGTLVPVIGVVQVGAQAMADRYLYLPGLPILCLFVWLGEDLARLSKTTARIVQGLFAATAIMFTGLTLEYLDKWRNTETIFTHALAVTGENSFAHLGLGNWHLNLRENRKAATHYAAFLKSEAANPGMAALEMDRAWVWANLGFAVAKLDDWEAAKRFTERAIHLDPTLDDAWGNLYIINGMLGLNEEADDARRRLLRLNPDEANRELKLRAVSPKE